VFNSYECYLQKFGDYMKKVIILLALFLIITSCSKKDEENYTREGEVAIIDKTTAEKVISEMVKKYGPDEKQRITRGVNQTAALWFEADGSKEEFVEFCKANYITDTTTLSKYAKSLETHSETIYGYFNKMMLDLKVPMQLEVGEMTDIDRLYGALNPAAHIADDLYDSKIAFMVTLNYPFYTLEEKMEMGKRWTREQWAYARIGDMFTSRVPAKLLSKEAEIETNSDQYIAEYNIMMGNLIDSKKATFFPKDMALITHWNLRDEIKAQYANKTDGLLKQKMILKVMERIIDQSIPQEVISNNKYQWEPYANKVFQGSKEIKFTSEPNTRYEWLLKNYKVQTQIDKFSPNHPSYIKRKFNSEMEIPVERIEQMFTELLSSPVAKNVAAQISKNLGRKLEPFDIWYNGFKGEIDGARFDKITKAKWKTAADFEAYLPTILAQLNWQKDRAKYITEKIAVDPARGAGHASGSMMKGDKAHLRTRIAADGMDYKGYNIAVHEFGHNVEQTITLYDMDNWFMIGIPNTAFTEAAAFLFQSRDLKLIGVKNEIPNAKDMYALDVFWSCYEIMGVSMVDIKVWQWMYENPTANAQELKEAVMQISKDVWNKYYAPVFGQKDQTILAIYSHMIAYPLYLSAYPLGHLIEFQLEQQIEGKKFSEEFDRIYKQGRLTPDIWMIGATGSPVSVKPVIKAADEAINKQK
jgi:hypothetical protein